MCECFVVVCNNTFTFSFHWMSEFDSLFFGRIINYRHFIEMRSIKWTFKVNESEVNVMSNCHSNHTIAHSRLEFTSKLYTRLEQKKSSCLTGQRQECFNIASKASNFNNKINMIIISTNRHSPHMVFSFLACVLFLINCSNSGPKQLH